MYVVAQWSSHQICEIFMQLVACVGDNIVYVVDGVRLAVIVNNNVLVCWSTREDDDECMRSVALP